MTDKINLESTMSYETLFRDDSNDFILQKSAIRIFARILAKKANLEENNFKFQKSQALIILIIEALQMVSLI